MRMVQSIGGASAKNADRVMATLISGLEMEFGQGAGTALAQRFFEAEESEFCWEARIQERWIDVYESADEADIDLDRVAIIGRVEGIWFVAVMIVDGNGDAHSMMGKRGFGCERAARAAFSEAR